MKFLIVILLLTTFLNTRYLSAHQDPVQKKTTAFSKTEISTKSSGNAGIGFEAVPENEDRCCCSDNFCVGPGKSSQEMSCKSHSEDLSGNINLTIQNSKNQNIYILLSKMNFLFTETDHRNIKSSSNSKYHGAPSYISIHSFLI